MYLTYRQTYIRISLKDLEVYNVMWRLDVDIVWSQPYLSRPFRPYHLELYESGAFNLLCYRIQGIRRHTI